MPERKQNYEGLDFSDDDDEVTDMADAREEVKHMLQEGTDNIARAFKDFLSEPSYLNSKGDPTTNIVDRHAGKCYNLPDRKIPKFMKYIEASRRRGLKMMLYEKQQEYSGIMLDFDIRLDAGGESPITHTHYHRLCLHVVKVLLKYLHFPKEEEGKKTDIYVGFIKKPRVLYDSDLSCYKDGLHMLIPGIQITRPFKKLLINKLTEGGEKSIIHKIFKDIKPHESNERTEFLDINSAHVGVFFVGSASKVNKPAYKFIDAYRVQATIGDEDDVIPVKIPDFAAREKDINICHEFSLNWTKQKNGVITKQHYEIKQKYSNLLAKFPSKPIEDEDGDDDRAYGELSILNIHDHNAKHIKELLDLLHPRRSENRDLWFKVLCVLANESESYKPLAQYFSMKCPEKYDPVGFETTWNSLLRKNQSPLTISSLYYWAKQDNPDRYEAVQKNITHNVLLKQIYDDVVMGCLEHYDMAKLLHKNLHDKFAFDKFDAEGGSWYEFILEGDKMKDGEMYKWRKYNGETPNSLLVYMSEILPNLCRKVLNRIKTNATDSESEVAKYQYTIYKNFLRSVRSLRNSAFKASVGRECRQLFDRIGFGEKMDTDPILKGVGNGILKLGGKCELITGFHGHYVSKFTTTKYERMNPHNPLTKKVLIALRNLFPDDEPDTFDYIMHYLASTLDGKRKESMFLILVGKGSNGKSFLVELHKGAIGDIYGVKMPLSFITSRSKSSETATPALMQLKDAHFAYYSESNRFEVLNMAKIKEVTGQETLAGRKLHQDIVNFKPKCHHLVASNNDFDVEGNDHGTWRRIDYINMKIKFCNLATDAYDPENPYERPGDSSLGDDWTEDPDVLSAYLGILVYYYESLQNNYGGKVRNVPHPHIAAETEKFRNRQDRVNNYLNKFLVKCGDEHAEMEMSVVRDRYVAWHNDNYPTNGGDFRRMAMEQLETSKLQKYIVNKKRGKVLRGYKVLNSDETIDEDDTYYTELHESKSNVVRIEPETAEEMHQRMCDEYDLKEPARPMPVQVVFTTEQSDDDSDIEEDIKRIKERDPTKNRFKKERENNIDETDVRGMPVRKEKVSKNKEFAASDSDECTDSDFESDTDSD